MHDDHSPVVTVLCSRTTLTIAAVDKLGGSLAICLKRAEDVVVDLAQEDLAAVCARRVVACQVHAAYHPRLIMAGEIDRDLS